MRTTRVTTCVASYLTTMSPPSIRRAPDSNATPGSELATLLTGEGGLPSVKLTSADGCTATAYLFGGVVTSFVKEVRTGNLDMPLNITSTFHSLSGYVVVAARVC
jgi:hypothetical protein